MNLVRQVLLHTGLKQRELATTLGIQLQRVKALSAGTTKELTLKELSNLHEKLHISAEWLITGNGPVFRTRTERPSNDIGAILTQRFEPGTAPRSDAYKAGFTYILRRKLDGISRQSPPYRQGTESHDAWVAGASEGLRFYRQQRDRQGVIE